MTIKQANEIFEQFSVDLLDETQRSYHNHPRMGMRGLLLLVPRASLCPATRYHHNHLRMGMRGLLLLVTQASLCSELRKWRIIQIYRSGFPIRLSRNTIPTYLELPDFWEMLWILDIALIRT